jgi:N-acetyl-D-muramate 6-phosphate phosphatase
MSPSPKRSDVLLLDLDGTLLDTAPDLTAALNRLMLDEGRPALDVYTVRQHVPNGAAALVRLAFGSLPPAESERFRQRLLDLYADNLSVETKPFEGFDELLGRVEGASMPWGVVTNKVGLLTVKLLTAQGLSTRASCIVSGDTVPEQKPHPRPLLHAAALIGRPPSECLYVGDSERDIQAGRAAGMNTVVARFGYIATDDEPERWNADGIVDHPLELIPWLNLPR